jgi:hypothetical protein
MKSSITWHTVPVVLATCVVSAALLAAEPPRAPPAEAFAACTSKQQGEKCSVQLGDREIGGVCSSSPDQKLFYRPDSMPPHAPPEALVACTSKIAGDACSVQLPDGALRSGVCRAGPDEKIACAPAEGPPPRP